MPFFQLQSERSSIKELPQPPRSFIAHKGIALVPEKNSQLPKSLLKSEGGVGSITKNAALEAWI
jgi:hypothetical protein